MILRNEDLDSQRCRAEFVDAMIEDLHWLGISWQEGPDCGGPYASVYAERASRLLSAGVEAVARDSGRSIRVLARARMWHWRPGRRMMGMMSLFILGSAGRRVLCPGPLGFDCAQGSRDGRGVRRHMGCADRCREPAGVNWRFRVPDGEEICFDDLHLGSQRMVAGRDFGDFIVWRRDDVPAYQLAVVVDDAAMSITEVVRGADLLKSTARQILLYRALGLPIPDFYHCDLVRDDAGVRLAKRHDSLSIRKLREMGWTPEQVREGRNSSRGLTQAVRYSALSGRSC